MSTNTIKVLSVISKEISRRYDVRADLIMSSNRQYDKPHTAFKANSGSSIEIKRPQKVKGTASAVLDVQDIEEQTTTLNINNDYHVGLGFTAAELTQDLLNPNNMKMFADDYLDAAIDDIIAKTQSDYYTFMKDNTYNSVGTWGTGPNSLQVVTNARAKLNNFRAPRGNRAFHLDPDNAALLNGAQTGLFHPGDAIASNYKDGSLSPANGFMFYECPDVGSHTNGAGASYTVNAGGQTGSTLAVNAGNSGAITAGSVFTIADVYQVDPVSRTAKNNLQQFVVTADFAGGAGNLSISPSIDTTSAYKTVDSSPANSAAITIIGTVSQSKSQGIAMHRDAFCFGTAELSDIGVKYEVPIITGGAGEGYSRNGGSQKGVYMKLYMDGDITNRRAVARLDIRYGYSTLVQEWATKVQGA